MEILQILRIATFLITIRDLILFEIKSLNQRHRFLDVRSGVFTFLQNIQCTLWSVQKKSSTTHTKWEKNCKCSLKTGIECRRCDSRKRGAFKIARVLQIADPLVGDALEQRHLVRVALHFGQNPRLSIVVFVAERVYRVAHRVNGQQIWHCLENVAFFDGLQGVRLAAFAPETAKTKKA